ncbi:MAG: manganese efflux pump [Ruminococcaceae bacterium]|nr:manganese efflux pump [Oscillospiraceae bacterium]
MNLGIMFFVESALLGVGLAMDAFSVSLANGLNEPCMKKPRMLGIAGVFAFFQYLMPMIGWVCVHTVAQHFSSFEKFIPWIALVLLCFIGGKMILDAFKNQDEDRCCEARAITIGALIMQGVATSIDALSVGFTISSYNLVTALICGLIIAVTTFAICLGGIIIGKKAGTRLANKAGYLGGGILIFIGFEIFISSFM